MEDELKRARAAAGRGAAAAGVEVRALDTLEELRAVEALFNEVWGPVAESVIRADLLRALTYGGNYIAGAFVGDEMIGALNGFLGIKDGEALLHSHILGVRTGVRSKGAGWALKQHQRAWALERRVERIEWTFDPLVARNAFFNLAKLGAGVHAYIADFYGEMPDAINAGDASDRVVIDWQVRSPAAVAAADGVPVEPASEGVARAVTLGEAGRPAVIETDADRVTCALPPDIVELRRTDREVAAEWRAVIRVQLGGRLADGWTVAGALREGGYVIERASS